MHDSVARLPLALLVCLLAYKKGGGSSTIPRCMTCPQGLCLQEHALAEPCMQLDTEHSVAMSYLATPLAGKGNLVDATKMMERVVEKQPNDADNHKTLAVLHFKQNMNEQAVAGYMRCIRAAPLNSDCYFGMGNSFLKVGRHEEALTAPSALPARSCPLTRRLKRRPQKRMQSAPLTALLKKEEVKMWEMKVEGAIVNGGRWQLRAGVMRLRGSGIRFEQTLDFSAFLANWHNVSIYCCAKCGAHISATNYVCSKKIQGRLGRAYMVSKVVNCYLGPREDRALTKGLHVVADIHCRGCETLLGWRHLGVYEDIYKRKKDGRYVLEKTQIQKVVATAGLQSGSVGGGGAAAVGAGVGGDAPIRSLRTNK